MRKPTTEEIAEFTQICLWVIRHPGKKGEIIKRRTSFAEIEWACFEGMNLPYKTRFLRRESFEKANERMKRYMEIDYESKLKLRSA